MRDHDAPRSSTPAFTRRAFLKGSSAAMAAGAVATTPVQQAEAAPKRKNVFGPEPVKITLSVNGRKHTVTVEPRVTLLEVLRNDLNLTGCKEVDDNTASGADTVLIDGKAVLASARLAIECQGKEIQTVESLRNGDRVDPVIAGFVKHDAMQCGFCTPGFVMAVRAFLNKHPNATLEQIRKGLGGNICRCGTYAGITRCALELARQ
ncbi:MAG: (2Fe-2S)-binding protein [Planctomycetota bacterium]|nr:MAG: (2Fe-2S)-binding protein [Planctomycetota bacterium]